MSEHDPAPSIDRETLADIARRNAQNIVSTIGPVTPAPHAAALVAIAQSWESFAAMVEL